MPFDHELPIQAAQDVTLAALYSPDRLVAARAVAARRGVSREFARVLEGEQNRFRQHVANGRRYAGGSGFDHVAPRLGSLLLRAQDRAKRARRYALSPEGRVVATLAALTRWADENGEHGLSTACGDLRDAIDRNFGSALPCAERLHAAAEGLDGARAFTGLIVETMKGAA